MRAIIYDTDGPDVGVLRAVELPDPVPGPGEVRVRLVVAGVNPTDWKSRIPGRRPRPWAWQVPGHDGAGVVDRVGPGVDPARVGQRVWVYLAAHGHALGAAAEYVCLPSGRAVELPDGVPFDVGAGLGVPALTAHHCLLADGPVAGRTVLITGGAGAVGHVAVQIARHVGARVITTVSTDEKAAIAATAEPDVMLRYRDPDHAQQLAAAAPDGIDRVLDVDAAANLATYRGLLNHDAVIAIYAAARPDQEFAAPVLPMMSVNATVRFMLLYGFPEDRLVAGAEDVTAMLRAGDLVPIPTLRYPLERLDEAHEHVRRGVVGKVLVDIAEV